MCGESLVIMYKNVNIASFSRKEQACILLAKRDKALQVLPLLFVVTDNRLS